MKTAGSGKYKVFLEERELGDDLVLLLYGGERPHAGAIVVAEPGKETKVMRLGAEHRDDVVAKPIAEKYCTTTGKKVVCVAGIHVDNATEDEIGLLVKNCRILEEGI